MKKFKVTVTEESYNELDNVDCSDIKDSLTSCRFRRGVNYEVSDLCDQPATTQMVRTGVLKSPAEICMTIDKATIENILDIVNKEYSPVTTKQYQISTIYATIKILEGVEKESE